MARKRRKTTEARKMTSTLVTRQSLTVSQAARNKMATVIHLFSGQVINRVVLGPNYSCEVKGHTNRGPLSHSRPKQIPQCEIQRIVICYRPGLGEGALDMDTRKETKLRGTDIWCTTQEMSAPRASAHDKFAAGYLPIIFHLKYIASNQTKRLTA